MRAALVCLTICGLLSGCAIGQNIYDNRASDECQTLPTPDERLSCERRVFDQGVERRAQDK